MLTALFALALPSPAQANHVSLVVDGTTRTARVRPGNGLKKPSPLVFCFHGHGGNGGVASAKFELHKYWPEAIVIYPDGLPGVPDDHDESGEKPSWQRYKGQVRDRDLKFFDALLKDAKSKFKVDGDQVYSVGFSNGGRFTYLLWTERRSLFGAVAVLGTQFLSEDLWKRAKPLPALVGHGKEDARNPFPSALMSFSKVVEVNKSDEKNHKMVGSSKVCPPLVGGVESVFVPHEGGHEIPVGCGKTIVDFLKRH